MRIDGIAISSGTIAIAERVHEQEHGERAERADHRDDEHARPTSATATIRLDLLEAGHRDGHACGRCGAQRGSDPVHHALPRPDIGIGHVDERPRGLTVA